MCVPINHVYIILQLTLFCNHSTCREQPVHLYDAYTGAIRATYRPYNAVDEMESPTVVEFSCDSQRLLCGGFRSDRMIHIFDVNVPGRDSTTVRLGKTRRSTDGQKGLVSAITSSLDGRYFAVGTFSPSSIYIYDYRTKGHFADQAVLNGLCVVGHGRSHSRRKRRFVHLDKDDSAKGNNNADGESSNEGTTGDSFIRQAKTKWFQARVRGGVTQLKFAPQQEYVLYSACRRSDSILTWDLRMLSDTQGSHPIRGLGSFSTVSNTNQRLEFDISDDGRTLFVGGMDRCVRIYDTQSAQLLAKIDDLDDAANGVSFTRLSNQNSYLSIATGSRRFPDIEVEEDEDEEATNQQQNMDMDQKDENHTKSTAAQPPGYLRLYQLDDQKPKQTSAEE